MNYSTERKFSGQLILSPAAIKNGQFIDTVIKLEKIEGQSRMVNSETLNPETLK
jgi:hypothetical protein